MTCNRKKIVTHLGFQWVDYLPFQIPPPSPQDPHDKLEEHSKKGKQLFLKGFEDLLLFNGWFV
jgi:hypothetical protein